jgi:hypothetical protein
MISLVAGDGDVRVLRYLPDKLLVIVFGDGVSEIVGVIVHRVDQESNDSRRRRRRVRRR